jgi:cold shock CspA family protein
MEELTYLYISQLFKLLVFKGLEDDQKVSYELEEGNNGKQNATNIALA